VSSAGLGHQRVAAVVAVDATGADVAAAHTEPVVVAAPAPVRADTGHRRDGRDHVLLVAVLLVAVAMAAAGSPPRTVAAVRWHALADGVGSRAWSRRGPPRLATSV
jgi:hypothetical protein